MLVGVVGPTIWDQQCEQKYLERYATAGDSPVRVVELTLVGT